MVWDMRRRYYCTNLGGCKYARDYVYSSAYFKKHAVCCGEQNDGCKKALKAESAQNYQQRIAPGMVLLLALSGIFAGGGYWYLHPRQVVGVTFEQQQSRVTQGSAQTVTLTISRSTDLDQAEVVKFQTEDGTAKSNQDYLPKHGELSFRAGEKNKPITVQILANGKSAAKSFLVTLNNVVGIPQHSVTIEPPKLDQESLSKADGLVRVISNLAMDLADLYLRGKHLNRMLNSSEVQPAMKAQFRAALSGVEENRERAAKRYTQTLKDLTQINAEAVAAGFKAWDAHLDGLDMQQQRKATDIAVRHYQEVLQGNPPQPDIWAMQLSKAIPSNEKASVGVQLL